jgi:hypothetical protein
MVAIRRLTSFARCQGISSPSTAATPVIAQLLGKDGEHASGQLR